MRITENKLRRLIRSVIRESRHLSADDLARNAQQVRDYQNHPNRAEDDRARKAFWDEIKQKAWDSHGRFNFHVERVVGALVDYRNHPEIQPQTRGMSATDIENLVYRANLSNVGSEESQKKLIEILDRDDSLGYHMYIGNKKFWREVYNKFEAEIPYED